LVIAHNPCGLCDKKMQLTKQESEKEAVEFAKRVKQAFEYLRSHVEQRGSWRGSVAVRKVIRQ